MCFKGERHEPFEMFVSTALRQRYEVALPHIEAVASEVRATLYTFCEEKGFAFLSRIKNLDSLAEKIECGRYSTWWELDDLFACTVVIPTLNHEPGVEEFCGSAFVLHSARRRGSPEKPFDVFRFDATRLYYRLRPPMGEDAPGTEKYRLLFEVQIKSAFDHAWSTATHDLTYKSNQIDWRRLRLSAQIKAIVEQLDVAILGFEQMAPLIAENPDRRLRIKREIGDLFRRGAAEKKIPEESIPIDFSRFVDNFGDMIRAAGLRPEEAVSIARQIVDMIMERDPQQFPRSLSLFQFCFAEATLNSFIEQTRDSYSVPITPELESLYPHVREYPRRFSME
jgi:ppGpp synthetase/RelA/SpoT-type nucleotidyltranferase